MFYDESWNTFICGQRSKQSCTRVQISRFDPTRPTKIVTRPDPLIFPASWIRPDPMTIHDGQKRLYARHNAHCPALTPRWPAARKVLPRFGLTRYMFLQYERIAICTQSPLYISCFQRHCTVTTECRLTCTLETSVVWLSNYLLWFVHGLAIKSRYVKQQLLVLYEYS